MESVYGHFPIRFMFQVKEKHVLDHFASLIVPTLLLVRCSTRQIIDYVRGAAKHRGSVCALHSGALSSIPVISNKITNGNEFNQRVWF